jgi:hypothetical protein
MEIKIFVRASGFEKIEFEDFVRFILEKFAYFPTTTSRSLGFLWKNQYWQRVQVHVSEKFT